MNKRWLYTMALAVAMAGAAVGCTQDPPTINVFNGDNNTNGDTTTDTTNSVDGVGVSGGSGTASNPKE